MWENCVVDGVATLQCVPQVFQNIVTAALIFAGVVALFFIIISGYKFLTSGGDPKQVDGARKTMMYAILGLILVLLSFAIVKFISITTGVDCINKFGFNQCDTTTNSSSVDNPDQGDTNDQQANSDDKGKKGKKKNNNNNDGHKKHR